MGLIVKVYPVGHTSLVVPVCSRIGNNYFNLFKEKSKICYKPEQGSLCSHFFKFIAFDFKGELRDVKVSYDKNLATVIILHLLVFSECAALSCTFSGLSLRTENVKLV